MNNYRNGRIEMLLWITQKVAALSVSQTDLLRRSTKEIPFLFFAFSQLRGIKWKLSHFLYFFFSSSREWGRKRRNLFAWGSFTSFRSVSLSIVLVLWKWTEQRIQRGFFFSLENGVGLHRRGVWVHLLEWSMEWGERAGRDGLFLLLFLALWCCHFLSSYTPLPHCMLRFHLSPKKILFFLSLSLP